MQNGFREPTFRREAYKQKQLGPGEQERPARACFRVPGGITTQCGARLRRSASSTWQVWSFETGCIGLSRTLLPLGCLHLKQIIVTTTSSVQFWYKLLQFLRRGRKMSVKLGKRTLTAEWLKQNHELYTAATNHSFIRSIHDGTIDVNNFKHWMEQDYHFVREFVRFVASVLLKVPKNAPEHDVDVILSGLTALDSEIAWFRKEANFWQIFLEGVTLLQPNKEYIEFLKELEKEDTPYAVAVTAFWLIELVYCASFMYCLEEDAKTPFELMSTVKRWGSQEFHYYTLSLKKLADKALENASEVERNQAHEVCVRILKLELKFWDMAGFVLG